MSIATDPAAPPSRELLLLEVRAVFELGAYFALYPLLRMAPRGDGHPVLVLPGFLASDTSTQPLRAFLKDRGYSAHGWKLGPNQGPRAGVQEQMQERLAELHARHGRQVSLVGWSLGGIFARELARRSPALVRSVITLGSPFAGAPKASNVWQLYQRVAQQPVGEHPWHATMRLPLPMPATAIYSRSDGIVAWQGCREPQGPQAESIEIEGSHSGLGHHPAALLAIADRLAQPAGQWQPFERSGARRFVYPDPYRDPPAAA